MIYLFYFVQKKTTVRRLWK